MESIDENHGGWGSRRVYLMVLLCQTIGRSAFIIMPSTAVKNGTTGHILAYIFVYIFLGIPLLYMEFIVSQFTARDCIDVWKIRPCLSHIGYIHIFWQVLNIVYNHSVCSFIVHYFLISFENPIPYYVCGSWATKDCNILANNFSVNEDCLKLKGLYDYCDSLYITFPEYQYWKNNILGVEANYFYIAWRACLASGLTCIFIYLNCFKRKKSVKYLISFLTLYPLLGYIILMVGSMIQKGLVVKYEDAFDSDFSVFRGNYRVSKIIVDVLHALNIGTGLSFNLGSTASFRSPCYSNTVITVVVSSAFTVLAVSTVAMMTCPYAYEYGTHPSSIMKYPMSLLFQKTTRLLYEYQYKSFWLILIFSCNALLVFSTNVIISLNVLDMIAVRYSRVAKYPGLVSFAGVTFLFVITVPLLGHTGVYVMQYFNHHLNFLSTFMGMVECIVFVLWYGLERFSEDVHFMQGIQPKSYMKVSWIVSSGILGYVFCNEIYHNTKLLKRSFSDVLGWWCLISILGMSFFVMVVKLSAATCRKRFKNTVRLDPMWGPRSELLLRSRAMFTAQAMTKEYMYRQYNLQAGIVARQRRSNTRGLRTQSESKT